MTIATVPPSPEMAPTSASPGPAVTRRAGARLHVRIVALFSVLAAVPAILVAVVASITLDRKILQQLSLEAPEIFKKVIEKVS